MIIRSRRFKVYSRNVCILSTILMKSKHVPICGGMSRLLVTISQPITIRLHMCFNIQTQKPQNYSVFKKTNNTFKNQLFANNKVIYWKKNLFRFMISSINKISELQAFILLNKRQLRISSFKLISLAFASFCFNTNVLAVEFSELPSSVFWSCKTWFRIECASLTYTWQNLRTFPRLIYELNP